MWLSLAFLFPIGSMVGWGLEVIFRRIFSAHRFINPGCLIGPYCPLYGCSLCVLYLLARLEPYIHIETDWLRKLVLFLCMAAAITLIEFVTGLIFIHGMKLKLWDYSAEKGNIMGIICPRFSFFWIVLSALYYLLIHPHILSALDWLSQNLIFSFFIGLFYGVFLVDVAYTFQLLAKIRAFAEKSKITVWIDELREDAHKRRREEKEKRRFFFTLKTDISLQALLEKYSIFHLHPNKKLEENQEIKQNKS